MNDKIQFELRNTLQTAEKLIKGVNHPYENGYGCWILLQEEFCTYTEYFLADTMKDLIKKNK